MCVTDSLELGHGAKGKNEHSNPSVTTKERMVKMENVRVYLQACQQHHPGMLPAPNLRTVRWKSLPQVV